MFKTNFIKNKNKILKMFRGAVLGLIILGTGFILSSTLSLDVTAQTSNCTVSKDGIQVCKIESKNNNLDEFTYSGDIIIKNGKVAGFANCNVKQKTSEGNANAEIKLAEYKGPNCEGVVFDRIGIGSDVSSINDVFKTESRPFLFSKDEVPKANDWGSIIRACSDSKPAQNDPNYIIYACEGERDLLTPRVYIKAKNDTTGRYVIKNAKFNDTNEITIEDKNTLIGLSGKQIVDGKLTSDQVDAINNAMLQVDKITSATAKSNNPITCATPILAGDNKSVIMQCTDKKGINYDLSGTKLGNNCGGFSFDSALIKSGDAKLNNNCITKEQVASAKATEANKAIQSSSPGAKNDLNSKGNENAEDRGNVLTLLAGLVLKIFFIIIYIFGWVGSFLLLVVGRAFVEVLSINPASPSFIGAAVRPWQVLVGLANLVVLTTFIAVGFGYILDIKSLKKNIREFLLQIAIFALLLNFSLLGTGVFVNLANGIGDAMVYSYAGLSKDGRTPNRGALIDGFIRGINRVSYIRCGIEEEGKESEKCKSQSTDPNVEGVGSVTNVIDDFSNLAKYFTSIGLKANTFQVTLLETIFLFVIVYALSQMWRAFQLVMFRLVGLWMLMITSPVALALYFSPIKALNKYSAQWVDLYWRSTLFYPFFVLALVLHTKLVEAIAFTINPTSQVTVVPTSSELGANLSVYAADAAGFEQLIITIVTGSLVAIISLVAWGAIVDFFEKTFGSMVSALVKGVGAAWKLFRGAGLASAAVIKGTGMVGGLIGNSAISKLDKWSGGKITGGLDRVSKFGEDLATRGGLIGGIGKGLSGAKGWNVGNVLSGAGNMLSMPFVAPAYAELSGKLLGKSFEAVTKTNTANMAGMESDLNGMIEKGLRGSGAAEALRKGGVDIDTIDGLNAFAGTGKAGMKELKEKGLADTVLNNRRRAAINKALGRPEKIDPIANQSAIKELLAKQQAAGGFDKLSQYDLDMAETLVNQGIFDAEGIKLLADPLGGGRDLVQGLYGSGNLTQEARNRIREKLPGLLPDNLALDRGAIISKIDYGNVEVRSAAFDEGTRNNGQLNVEDIRGKTGNDHFDVAYLEGTERELKQMPYYSRLAESGTPLTAAWAKGKIALVNQQNSQIGTGTLIKSEVVFNDAARDAGHLKADGTPDISKLTVEQKLKAITDEYYGRQWKNEYGFSIDPTKDYSTQDILQETSKLSLDDLRRSYAGNTAERAMGDRFKGLSDEEKRIALQGSVGVAASLDFVNKDRNAERMVQSANAHLKGLDDAKKARVTQDLGIVALDKVSKVIAEAQREGRGLDIAAFQKDRNLGLALGASEISDNVRRNINLETIEGLGDIFKGIPVGKRNALTADIDYAVAKTIESGANFDKDGKLIGYNNTDYLRDLETKINSASNRGPSDVYSITGNMEEFNKYLSDTGGSKTFGLFANVNTPSELNYSIISNRSKLENDAQTLSEKGYNDAQTKLNPGPIQKLSQDISTSFNPALAEVKLGFTEAEISSRQTGRIEVVRKQLEVLKRRAAADGKTIPDYEIDDTGQIFENRTTTTEVPYKPSSRYEPYEPGRTTTITKSERVATGEQIKVDRITGKAQKINSIEELRDIVGKAPRRARAGSATS